MPSDRSPWTHRRGSVPLRRVHAGVPYREECVHVGLAPQLFGAGAREFVGRGERPAALTGPRGWRARGVDALEREHERGEVGRQLVQVERAVEPRVLAFEPRRDVPDEGIALGGLAHRDRHRHLDGKMRREPGEPWLLLLSLLRRPSDLREAHRKVVAEAEIA